MPQARGVTTRPACGSLSRRMTSKPRNNSAWVQALTMTPSWISTRTSRSPSTRPTGEMSSVCTAVVMGWSSPMERYRVASDDEDVVLGPARRSRLGGYGELDVAGLVDAGRHVLGQAHDGLRLEQGPGRKIEEREFRFGAAEAGHSGPRFRRLPIPQDAVARRMG